MTVACSQNGFARKFVDITFQVVVEYVQNMLCGIDLCMEQEYRLSAGAE